MKRDAVKYVRDAAKQQYSKDSECYVTGSAEQLELHHLNSISHLYHKWRKAKSYLEEDVEEHRDEFIQEHHKELYEDVVTLTKYWHRKLHSIYGERPLPSTAIKQRRWLDKMRAKHYVKRVQDLDSGEDSAPTGD